MGTITNFESDNLPMMEVDVVMVSENEDEDTPKDHLEFKFLEGDLDGEILYLGNWEFTDTTYDNGDGEIRYSAFFADKSPEENDEMCANHVDLIREIASTIITQSIQYAEQNELSVVDDDLRVMEEESNEV